MKPLVIEAKEIPYKDEYVLYMGIHDLPIDEKIIYQSAEFFICGREYDNTKEYCCCNKLEIFTESLKDNEVPEDVYSKWKVYYSKMDKNELIENYKNTHAHVFVRVFNGNKKWDYEGVAHGEIGR